MASHTIDTRVISGRGLLLAPSSDPNIQKAKVLSLTANVIRPPLNQSANSGFNPSRVLYARISCLRGGNVLTWFEFAQDGQTWDFAPDISAQAIYAIKCAYSGLLQSFVNLGIALDVIPIEVTNNISAWSSINLFPDEFRVVCTADCAIQLTLVSTDFDICPDDTSTQTPPPIVPARPDPVPLSTPIPQGSPNPISEPYVSPSDNGNTVPYPTDNQPPTPPPVEHTWTVTTSGLNPDCSASSSRFTANYTAYTVSFTTATIPPGGEFAGCTYDFLVLNGISMYPSLDGGSAPGTGVIVQNS